MYRKVIFMKKLTEQKLESAFDLHAEEILEDLTDEELEKVTGSQFFGPGFGGGFGGGGFGASTTSFTSFQSTNFGGGGFGGGFGGGPFW